MSDSGSVISSGGHVQHNGLAIEGPPWDLEKLYDYEAGGHHPMHLNDILRGRYRVIHKLGSGGFANVWLCRDVSASTPKYVAVKILMADHSTAECPELRITEFLKSCCDEKAAVYLSLPLDHFEIHGPNGDHYVFATKF
jgi:hypothetical protein